MWEGGAYDYPSKAVAAVMASTIQEATESMDVSEVADFIDFCGARINGAVSPHHVSLDLIAINSRLSELLPLMADMARNAAFPDYAVEAAAKRHAANRALQLERVSFLAESAFQALMQGKNHPASKFATPLEFNAVDSSTVKLLYDIARQSKLHVFAGGMISDEIANDLIAVFGQLPSPAVSPMQIIPFTPEEAQTITIKKKDTVQAAVAMGMPAIGRDHPDYIKLRLTVMALGGYFGSRLMANIREEKGLTYGINSALIGSQEGAYVEIQAQCDARYVEQVVDETRREIANLAANPPKSDELNRLRLHAWSALASAADSAFGTLDHYITHLKVGTPDGYFKQQLEAIASLTTDDIARMTAMYLDPASLSVVICD